jgi:hypothetical protein
MLRSFADTVPDSPDSTLNKNRNNRFPASSSPYQRVSFELAGIVGPPELGEAEGLWAMATFAAIINMKRKGFSSPAQELVFWNIKKLPQSNF